MEMQMRIAYEANLLSLLQVKLAYGSKKIRLKHLGPLLLFFLRSLDRSLTAVILRPYEVFRSWVEIAAR